MEVVKFIKTLYFGDRFCTKVVFDGGNNQIELHVNRISRIRDESGDWNYYSEEDIENGILVFTGIKSVDFRELDYIPNDQIYCVNVSKIEDDLYEFVIETSHVDQEANTHDLTMKLVGENVYLVDPLNLDVKICD